MNALLIANCGEESERGTLLSQNDLRALSVRRGVPFPVAKTEADLVEERFDISASLPVDADRSGAPGKF